VDAEPFYTWGSLLPMIADLEVFGTDPWDGTCFGCAGDDERSATGYVAGAAYAVELGPASTALSRDGTPLLRADVRGRFRHLSVDGARLSVELPPAPNDFTVELAVGPDAGAGADAGAVPGADAAAMSGAGAAAMAGAGAAVTLDGTPAPESRIGPIRRDGDGRDWLPIRIPAASRPRVLGIASQRQG
jgi:putative isomerase